MLPPSPKVRAKLQAPRSTHSSTLTRGLLIVLPLLLVTSLTVGSPVLRIADSTDRPPQPNRPLLLDGAADRESHRQDYYFDVAQIAILYLPWTVPGRCTWTALREDRYSVGRGLSPKLS